MANAAFLVVEPVPLVAEDLAACITDALGAVEVIVAATMEEASARIAGGHARGPALAVVHAGPAEYSESPLAVLLQTTGTRVTFMGDRAEQAAAGDAGLEVLETPFSTASVRAFLARLGFEGSLGMQGEPGKRTNPVP